MKQIHRKRLRKLAEYLLTQVPKEKFDMSYYRDGGNIDHICGTAGCALGWSPAIMLESTFRRYMSRSNDLVEMFSKIISTEYFGINLNGEAWLYLFASSWANLDNTPQGAAARILYLLDHGVPDWFIRGVDPSSWDVSHYQKYLKTGA